MNITQVTEILKDCVADAITRNCLKPDMHCKVELVVDDSKQVGWQAVRLTTKGCSGYLFRSIGKAKVLSDGKEDALRT